MDLIATNNFEDFKNIDVITTKDLYDYFKVDDNKKKIGSFLIHDVVEHFYRSMSMIMFSLMNFQNHLYTVS